VVARVFSSDGTGATARIVNTYRPGDQFAPQASVAGGNYLLVWTSFKQDGSLEGVYGQFLANDGTPSGNEVKANTPTISGQMLPALASDRAGRFLVVWSSFVGGSSDFDLFAQRYYDSNFVPPVATPYFYGSPPAETYANDPPPDPGSPGSGPGL